MVFWTSFNVSLLRLFATLAAEWHQAFSKLASDLPQKWLFLKGFRCCWKNRWKLWWQRSLFQRFLLFGGPWWPSSRWGWFLVRRGSLWWHWSSQICVLVFSLSPPFLVYYRYVHFTFPLVYRYSGGFLKMGTLMSVSWAYLWLTLWTDNLLCILDCFFLLEFTSLF